MIRRESVTLLAVFRCIVPGCIAYGSIEMFFVNELGVDVFVTVSADNGSARRFAHLGSCPSMGR